MVAVWGSQRSVRSSSPHQLEAVGRSGAWVETLADYLGAGTFDEAARAAFHCLIPEQTLDPGARDRDTPCRTTRVARARLRYLPSGPAIPACLFSLAIARGRG